MTNYSLLQGQPGLILGSGSRFRRDMLERAGVRVTVDPAHVDEPAVRHGLELENPSRSAESVATALAIAKALNVSARHPGALVIGSDQILAADPGAGDRPEIFGKPANLQEAAAHIVRLQGRTHYLHSAVVLARDHDIVWQTVSTAVMTMRALSPAEIDRYVQRAGISLCETVGAYMLEDIGIQLFERIEGDYFTIIGLPLLPLLAALRERGEVSL